MTIAVDDFIPCDAKTGQPVFAKPNVRAPPARPPAAPVHGMGAGVHASCRMRCNVMCAWFLSSLSRPLWTVLVCTLRMVMANQPLQKRY